MLLWECSFQTLKNKCEKKNISLAGWEKLNNLFMLETGDKPHLQAVLKNLHLVYLELLFSLQIKIS